MEKQPIESYFMKPEEEEVEIKFLRGKKGEKGEDGYTPIKNKDYFDGKDGKSPKVDVPEIAERVIRLLPLPKNLSEEKILKSVLEKIPKQEEIKPDTGKEIISKVNANKTDKIKKEKIAGLDELEQRVDNNQRNNKQIWLKNYIEGVGTSKITLSATQPTNPDVGDIWINSA